MSLAIGAAASVGARAAIASRRPRTAVAVPSAVPAPWRTSRCVLAADARGSSVAVRTRRAWVRAIRRVRTRAIAASDPEEPRIAARDLPLDASAPDGQDATPTAEDKARFEAGERARLSLGESLDLIPAVWRVVRRRWPRVLIAALSMAFATGLLLSTTSDEGFNADTASKPKPAPASKPSAPAAGASDAAANAADAQRWIDDWSRGGGAAGFEDKAKEAQGWIDAWKKSGGGADTPEGRAKEAQAWIDAWKK